MEKEHIKAHTGLRGVTAAMVAMLHMHYEDIVPPHIWGPFLNVIVSWYPVDIFFILSGFILGYVYVQDIDKPDVNYKDYLIKRIARVVPLHYLTLFAVGLMALTAASFGLPNRGYHLSDLPQQLLLIHAYPYIGIGAWNGPSWSISMEFLAYLFVFPVLLKLGSKVGKNYGAILLILIGLAVTWALTPHKTAGWPATMRLISHFSTGYLLYALTTFKNPIERIASGFVSTWLLLALCWIGSFNADLFSYFTSRLLFSVIFSMLILGLANNKESLAKTVLANKVFLWLGTISYSVYMIHNLIGKVIHAFIEKIPESFLIRGIILVGSYGSLLIASWLTYKFFEVPARNYVIGLFKKRAVSAKAVAAESVK